MHIMLAIRPALELREGEEAELECRPIARLRCGLWLWPGLCGCVLGDEACGLRTEGEAAGDWGSDLAGFVFVAGADVGRSEEGFGAGSWEGLAAGLVARRDPLCELSVWLLLLCWLLLCRLLLLSSR